MIRFALSRSREFLADAGSVDVFLEEVKVTELVQRAVEAGLRGQAPASAASPLSELLTRITGRSIQDMQHLTPATSLESALGLTSLERVELLSVLEDRYQIDLSETA